MMIEIKSSTFKPVNPKRCHLIWRIYGTRKVFTYPSGRRAPQPGTWELVKEVHLTLKRGRVTIPAVELEPTDGHGWQFYNPVFVDADGQEKWHPHNEITLTQAMVDEFEEGEFCMGAWMLYNMELKGEIAPGQLHD
jgi:hypothetical protein